MGGFFIGENQCLTQLMSIFKVFLTENTRYKDKILNPGKVNIITSPPNQNPTKPVNELQTTDVPDTGNNEWIK